MTTKHGYACIGLYQPKNDSNIGGAMRAAMCYGANLILVQGKRYKKMPTDTTKTWRHVPVLKVDDIMSNIPLDCVPIAIEITNDAKPIKNFVHPERALYIFGPEDGSINKNVIDRCKYVVYIPTNHCMNLASTVNVVLFDRNNKRDIGE